MANPTRCLECRRVAMDSEAFRCRRHLDVLLRRRHRNESERRGYSRREWRRLRQRLQAGLVELTEVTT